MEKPFLLVQLSDPHVGAEWVDRDPVAMLAAAVQSVRQLEPNPDAVLISGDLAEHAADGEYDAVRELLAPLEAPLYVLPGNHDDRAALRRRFGVAGVADQPVQYTADLGRLRLVVVDSTRAGEVRGELDEDRLAWLDATLGAAPGTPTVVALHHPPLATGIPVERATRLRPPRTAGRRARLARAAGAVRHVAQVNGPSIPPSRP